MTSSTTQSSTVAAISGGGAYAIAKRLLDISLALLVLVALAPLWVLIALAVKLTSPGPILFRQTKEVGLNGGVFTLYKFRTMFANVSEQVNAEFQKNYIKNNQPYAYVTDRQGRRVPVYKVVNDPRVTPLGKTLRRLGLDEVPQFLNVLKGDMSIVGPRPATLYEYEHYSDVHKQRLSVLPGITGLHQVTSRSAVGFEEMVRTDLEYIAQRSLWLDIKIIVKTPIAMLTGRGAY